MKRLIPLLFLLLFPSCRHALLPYEGRRDNWDPHSGHSYQRNPPAPPADSILLTGIGYPDGYDWVRDTAHSTVKANILLLQGNKELLRSVPAGGDEPWPADPDCHRIWNGHLYTFATLDGCTVIGRDGEEVLRYSAAESIRGFAVEDGHILTLGQNASGHGLSFRRDGRVLFLSDDGTVCGSLDRGLPRSGALYSDNGHWHFSFREGGRIHLVEDNMERALPEGNHLDARVHHGLLMLVSAKTSSYRTELTMTAGSHSFSLGPVFHSGVRSASFIFNGGLGRIVADVGGSRYVWDAGSTRLIGIYGEPYCELYPKPGGDAAVFMQKGRVVRIDPYGEPPGEYGFVSGACALSAGNTFFVGLSGMNGNPAMLLRDSLQTVFNFNGPITSLCLE
ncbi:MAG: hypothetical protein J5769_04050 [Bacteroidales bacterium]|nr:hypothetical protein [Bacteroidales bacterium]